MTPARAATRRNSVRTAAPDYGLPRVGPSMMQEQRPDRQFGTRGQPWAQLLPRITATISSTVGGSAG
jgi:hypothetical protein